MNVTFVAVKDIRSWSLVRFVRATHAKFRIDYRNFV